MSAFSQTSLIVLGAGLSSRFGSDKLAADLGGRPLATHLLSAIEPIAFAQKILVARGQDWTRGFADAGFEVLANSFPQLGLSSSLRIALSRASGQNVLVMLADMPFVSNRHLRSIEAAFSSHPGHAVASIFLACRSPPALFNREVLAHEILDGDQGARTLLDFAIAVPAQPGELRDIDRPSDWWVS